MNAPGQTSPIITATQFSVINLLTIRGLMVKSSSTEIYLDDTSLLQVNDIDIKGLYPTDTPVPALGAPTVPSSITSGTVYQNTNLYSILLSVPITFPVTADTATTAYLRSGTSDIAGDNPTYDEISEPDTLATVNGRTLFLHTIVPAGQYFEVDVTNATIGTPLAVKI